MFGCMGENEQHRFLSQITFEMFLPQTSYWRKTWPGCTDLELESLCFPDGRTRISDAHLQTDVQSQTCRKQVTVCAWAGKMMHTPREKDLENNGSLWQTPSNCSSEDNGSNDFKPTNMEIYSISSSTFLTNQFFLPFVRVDHYWLTLIWHLSIALPISTKSPSPGIMFSAFFNFPLFLSV